MLYVSLQYTRVFEDVEQISILFLLLDYIAILWRIYVVRAFQQRTVSDELMSFIEVEEECCCTIEGL